MTGRLFTKTMVKKVEKTGQKDYNAGHRAGMFKAGQTRRCGRRGVPRYGGPAAEGGPALWAEGGPAAAPRL